MEREPKERCALDRLCLYALNAIDVEEVVLVVVRDKSFHLLRTHAAVWLRNIDDRQIEVRKDIDARPHDSQHGRKRQCDNQDDDGDGPPKGDTNKPHKMLLSSRLALQ